MADSGGQHLSGYPPSCHGRQPARKGYSSAVFPLAEQFCRERGIHSIRVDTHAENKIMQHLIPKAGFTYCGIVYYDGSPRTAFEKIID